MDQRTNRKELRHDKHTVSLLTDHMVFAPKYRGKILTGEVAMITEGILCKTCRELNIEIAVNPDHVHIFFKYPPKYSLSFIAKRLKGRTSRILRKEFPHIKEFCDKHLWEQAATMDLLGIDGRLWRDTSKHKINTLQNRLLQASYLSPGFSDCGRWAFCASLEYLEPE